jgi:hypothetical protein
MVAPGEIPDSKCHTEATRQDDIAILRAVDTVMDGRPGREGQRLSLLPENFDSLSQADQDVAIDEGIAELMEAEVIRTRKGGGARHRQRRGPPGVEGVPARDRAERPAGKPDGRRKGHAGRDGGGTDHHRAGCRTGAGGAAARHDGSSTPTVTRLPDGACCMEDAEGNEIGTALDPSQPCVDRLTRDKAYLAE